MMTVKQAREAVRKARRVYVGVVFFDDGDQAYVRTSKREVMEIVTARARGGRPDQADVRCVVHQQTGDVYFN